MDRTHFRRAVEERDLDGMVACLAPEVRLFSPVSFKPFEGRDAVRQLFGVLLEAFEDFTYVDELAGEGVDALVFTARIGDRKLDGIDILRFGEDGLVETFTVMVRPMSALAGLAEAVGGRLASA